MKTPKKISWSVQTNENKDKNSLTEREIVFSDKTGKEVVSFGFIPYERHPLTSGDIISVPDFSSMRSDDRYDARRNFAATYHKFEFTTYCTKNAKRKDMYDCVNIITERGVWWGMVLNTKRTSGINADSLVSASNYILEEIENDDEGNPFCVIYSGPVIRGEGEKDEKRLEIISAEFGGTENIPDDHPYCVTRRRIASVAYVRVGDKGKAVLASIKSSDLSRFCDDKPTPGSSAPSFCLEKFEEGDSEWKGSPHVNIKRLAMTNR
jgi:hypothetical protein